MRSKQLYINEIQRIKRKKRELIKQLDILNRKVDGCNIDIAYLRAIVDRRERENE